MKLSEDLLRDYNATGSLLDLDYSERAEQLEVSLESIVARIDKGDVGVAALAVIDNIARTGLENSKTD